MKLMFTFRDNYGDLPRIITADLKYIRWCDEPLRGTEMPPMDLIKVSKGTVMPKHWIR